MTTKEIRQLIDDRIPVIYDGKEYDHINALIYRVIADPYNGKLHNVIQVELADKNTNSVIIADPRKVSAKK